MACVEHRCSKCEAVWFDNSGDRECPECGSEDSIMMFDEDGE